MVIYLSSCLCLLFLLFVIKLLNKIWWTPIRIQSQMRSQGIKGPSYKFFHGNNKEITNMKNEMIMSSSPMQLSHQIFPITEPHIYSWIKLYGTNFLMWHGSQAELVVAEPKLIKEVMNDNRSFPKREPREYLKLLGNGLVTTRGEKWHKKRKLAVNAFHAENLKVPKSLPVHFSCHIYIRCRRLIINMYICVYIYIYNLLE